MSGVPQDSDVASTNEPFVDTGKWRRADVVWQLAKAMLGGRVW
jgi:hypothetical protein